MSDWLDVVDDAKAVRAIYGSSVPSLTGIAVRELSANYTRPEVLIRFDLPEFPGQPPKKWAAQGFNTVQISLALISVEGFSVTGWSNDVVGDLSLVRDIDLIRTAIRSDSVQADFVGGHAYVRSVSAYLDTARR